MISTLTVGILIGGLCVFVLCLIIVGAFIVAEDSRDDFDDSLEKLRAAARHPSKRVP